MQITCSLTEDTWIGCLLSHLTTSIMRYIKASLSLTVLRLWYMHNFLYDLCPHRGLAIPSLDLAIGQPDNQWPKRTPFSTSWRSFIALSFSCVLLVLFFFLLTLLHNIPVVNSCQSNLHRLSPDEHTCKS